MLKKGRKRESKGLAVVYFIIGLIILLIILAVIYFALVELDYSDRIKNPDATIRSYVEMTPDPNAFDIEDEEDVFEDDELDVDVDLTETTPEPTPTPSPTPSPTPTPVPTPTPTPLPATMIQQPRTDVTKLPAAAPASCQAAITKCTVSVGDNNRVMYLAGYGYINDKNFDGTQAKLFLVVTNPKTSQIIAYQANQNVGVSGVTHDTAVCKNASTCDFEVSFDVSQLYTGDVYNLGIVIGYKAKGRKASYVYYAFPSDVNFTVLDGQVVEPVRVADTALSSVGNAQVGQTDATGSAVVDSGFDTSEPVDMTPPPTAVSPFITQAPAGDAGTQDPAALQQQIIANQMGVG